MITAAYKNHKHPYRGSCFQILPNLSTVILSKWASLSVDPPISLSPCSERGGNASLTQLSLPSLRFPPLARIHTHADGLFTACLLYMQT